MKQTLFVHGVKRVTIGARRTCYLPDGTPYDVQPISAELDTGGTMDIDLFFNDAVATVATEAKP